MNGLKLAVRTLAKTPFVTGIAILSLALGIGANAAIYSLFDQMLLRSLPVLEPDRLVNLSAPGPKPGSQTCGPAGGCDDVFSYPMFRDLEAASTGLDGLAAHVAFAANLSLDGATTSGGGHLISGSYFSVLGVQPALGRLLGPADDERVGEHYVTVLSYSYWENHLGLDRSILNTTLIVNGQPMTIVGVSAAGFTGTTLGGAPDLFVPITMREAMIPRWEGFASRRSYWAYVFGRLRPGSTIEQASAEINTVYGAIINEVEAPLQDGMSEATMERFRAKQLLVAAGYRGQSSLNSEAETPLKLLFSITGFVLLIACANIANLLLARGASRAQEMAIRGSLGASRRRLLGQLLTESVLLAVMGGIASLIVARWTLTAISATLPPEQAGALLLELSPTMIVFTGLVSLGTGLLFGMYPALHSSRQDLVAMLKAGGGQPSSARAATRFRQTLVTGQIALSMALLVAAGLFIKSLRNVTNVDLGLDMENVTTFEVAPELNGYEPERSQAIFARLEEELAAIPGVTGVSAAMVPVLSGSNWGTDVSVEGWESGPDIDSNARLNAVGPGFFSTLGMPLLAGREFSLADAMGAPKVAVVNEAFTRKFNLNGREAVGKWMSTHGGGSVDLDIQIVGVVQDARYASVKQDVPPLFFTPYKQNDGLGDVTFYVKSALEGSQVLAAIPALVAGIDPNLPVDNLKTLEQQVRENVYLDRLIGTLSAAFATLATLLAAVGLYGVLAYTVAQRTREIGVRMALGARSHDVRAMVMKQVSQMTAIGGIIGIVGAYFIGRFAQSLLFGLDGSDPFVMVGVASLLAIVAFSAGYMPARKASKIDPVQALRYE